MESVYKDKKEFVENLKPALLRITGVEDIEYKNFDDKYSEFIRIAWEGGSRDYIDVTANSKAAILGEISTLLSGGKPFGYISNLNHQNKLDAWFDSDEVTA